MSSVSFRLLRSGRKILIRLDVIKGKEVVYERTDNATQCWCEAGVGKYERGAGIVQECHWLLSGVGYAELPRFTFIYGRILALASVLTKRLALILQNPLFFTSFFRRSTLASLAFCKNIANKLAKLLRLGIKKIKIFCSALDFS